MSFFENRQYKRWRLIALGLTASSTGYGLVSGLIGGFIHPHPVGLFALSAGMITAYLIADKEALRARYIKIKLCTDANQKSMSIDPYLIADLADTSGGFLAGRNIVNLRSKLLVGATAITVHRVSGRLFETGLAEWNKEVEQIR